MHTRCINADIHKYLNMMLLLGKTVQSATAAWCHQ